jgi:hypothetical protein
MHPRKRLLWGLLVGYGTICEGVINRDSCFRFRMPHSLLLVYGHYLTYHSPSRGGIDSASSAIIVFSMCRLVVDAVKAGNEEAIKDVQMICAEEEWLPTTPQELCGRIFHTCELTPINYPNLIFIGLLGFMGIEKNSSKDTRKRAKDLSEGKLFIKHFFFLFPTPHTSFGEVARHTNISSFPQLLTRITPIST